MRLPLKLLIKLADSLIMNSLNILKISGCLLIRLFLPLVALALLSGCFVSAKLEEVTETDSVLLVPDSTPPTSPPSSPATDGISKVKNINTADKSSSPGSFVNYNGYTYFLASTPSYGSELWRTDGTPQGTELFKDVNPGPAGSSISNLKVVNGILYFSATTADHGDEPWRTDGTLAGTYMLGDLKPGISGSYPGPFLPYSGQMIFRATEPVGFNSRIWISDGTPSGTSMISSTVSVSLLFGEVNGFFLFAGNDGTNGSELWRTDGTQGNTIMVKDIRMGAASGVNFQSEGYGYLIANNRLYFTAFTGVTKLFSTDGTDLGTVEVGTNINSAGLFYANSLLYIYHSGSGLRVYDGSTASLISSVGGSFGQPNQRALITTSGELYYYGSNGEGTGLWMTDGVGSIRVMDLDSSSTNIVSSPSMAQVGDGVVFFAYEVASGWELYFDSPTTSPVLVKDILPGADSSVPSASTTMIRLGSQILFSAFGPEGKELWITDGTSGGTQLVKDIFPGLTGSVPTNISSMAGPNILFGASTQNMGTELWISDGTLGGTSLLKNINLEPAGSGIFSPSVLNGELLFIASDAENGNEVWKTDGTELGTVRITDLGLGDAGYVSGSLVPMGPHIYFYGNNGTNTSIWKISGSTFNSSVVNPLFSGTAYYTSDLYAVGNKLLMANDDPTLGIELFSNDGTGDTTLLVKERNVGFLDGIDWAANFYSNGIKLFIEPGRDDQEPWVSDGTEAGTFMLKNINPTTDSYPYNFFSNGSITYFTADDGVNGYELWKTDGTSLGTEFVKDINIGGDSYPEAVANLGNKTLFVADDGSIGDELWITDGTDSGTLLIKDIEPGSGSSSPQNFALIGTKLIFSAFDSTNGEELWITDGTPTGTTLLKDIFPGATGSSAKNMYASAGVVYFSANDGVHGEELWKTDGTPDGTVLVADIYPGINSSLPVPLVLHNGKLYLSANDGVDGAELFTLNNP